MDEGKGNRRKRRGSGEWKDQEEKTAMEVKEGTGES